MRRQHCDFPTIGRRFSSVLAPTVLVLLLAVLAVQPVCAGESAGESADEIDATVWEVISATVTARDIDRMAAIYHPDAVLVSPRATVAIADQLAKWGEDMERQRVEGRSARVSFRFSSRQGDSETAFERGIFRYAETDEHGVEQPVFVPFEALLVKRDGRWLLLMERQLEATDEIAWNALSP